MAIAKTSSRPYLMLYSESWGKMFLELCPLPRMNYLQNAVVMITLHLYIVPKSMEFKVVISVLQWCLGVVPCSKASFIQSGWKIGPSCFISFNWKVFAVLGLTEMISEYWGSIPLHHTLGSVPAVGQSHHCFVPAHVSPTQFPALRGQRARLTHPFCPY